MLPSAAKKIRLLVRQKGHRRQGDKQPHGGLHVLLHPRVRHGHEELAGPLGPPHEDEVRLAGGTQDVGDVGGDVVAAHVCEGEGPELLVLVRVPLGVVPGEGVPAGVGEPDVVAQVEEPQRRGQLGVIHQPAPRRSQNPVLQQQHRPPGVGQAESPQDIPVVRLHPVALRRDPQRCEVVRDLILEGDAGLALRGDLHGGPGA
mmetsp:Transcript_58650/g.156833  ORF Transcript_58650/g.156833 Transcript_58650/m.156833 type:complete len:202 (-) Transcript_58650:37-642(-)